MPFRSGDIFAGYVIQRLLGTGGMGEVYLAQHPRLPRQDALKILSVTSTVDSEFRARFVREAELAATLRHPHIVGVLDRGEFDGQLWISMDFVDGVDAGQLIKESHSDGLPERDASEIVTAVADALDFGHEHRLLHRDVKPENILVTTSNGRRRRVLLTDFGIARRIDDVSNLTDDNVAIGTVSYIAPEQLMGRPLDGRADQYALAATTFHLLTGAPPFPDSNRAVVISQHLGSPPPRISDRRSDLAHLDAVLARALAKDPKDRYPSCLDFAHALTQPRPPRDAAPSHPQSDSRTDHVAGAPRTQRLTRVVAHGTAHGVEHTSTDPHGESGTLSFQLVPHDAIDPLPARLMVHLQTQLDAVQLADGDEVEVSGVWDNNTLDADEIRILPADARPKERKTPPSSVTARLEKAPTSRRSRTPAFAALAVVIVVTAAAVAWFTDGFGLWTRPGTIVESVSATVFAPSGSPDNPDEADLAIDGDPATSWSTVTYTDPVPFPNFVEGQGLMLHLSEATELSAVTIDLSSTGTEVQIRSSPTETPATLADTTQLTPATPLQPGHNRIDVDDQTKTSNVLVWITTLGTTDGRSRTEISEITLQSAG